MKPNKHRSAAYLSIAAVIGFASPLAEEPVVFAPTQLHLEAKAREGGWTEWTGIIPKITFSGERISCMFLDDQERVWLGTSRGRVLTRSNGQWTMEAQADAQVTGVAIETPGRVWLSTGDGLRRLDRQTNNSWRVTGYRTYYQGHPALVSGAYNPGLDAERLWGYVDGVYIPPKLKTYAPFVVSTEHGLFTWGGYHGVWHHFLPHYWGANSAWLDTRDLIPHRRPTCMLEDGASNLWVGTDGDGLVRFNANARDYFRRDPEHNQKDGTEFSTFGVKEIGCDFDTVRGLSSSANDRDVWALLQTRDRKCHLAWFDGQRWSTLPLEHRGRCLVEVEPGVVLVGTDHGLLTVRFDAKRVDRLPGFDENVFNNVFRIGKTQGGTVLCASTWAFFERERRLSDKP